MNISQLILISFATSATLTSLAQSGPDVRAASEPAPKSVSVFESTGDVPARDFVTEDWMDGRLHRISEIAYNDGFRNTYVVVSNGLEYQVTGTQAVMDFVRELYAIDYLRGVSKTEEFGKAIANAGKQKIESVVDFVKHPVGSIKNVPKGASRFFGRIEEGLKGGKSESESGALAGITGMTKAKVQIAAKLRVNPYSSNEVLQEELSGVARASAGGGLLITGATAAIGGGAGTALSAVGVNETLQTALMNSTPEDLRIENRKKLVALHADRDLTEEFLMHPWFSPWHETITVDSLRHIGANPNPFLGNACKALTVEDAFYFQRTAQILAEYSRNVTPLRSIRSERGITCGLDKNGTLVVPVSLDFAIWTEQTARRAKELVALSGDGNEVKAIAFWTDGRISKRMSEELTRLGIAHRTLVLNTAPR